MNNADRQAQLQALSEAITNNALLSRVIDNPALMETMPHSILYRLRTAATPQQQAIIGPFEHRAFAREYAQESPIAATLSLPFAIPAYTAAKALGMTHSRSPASLDEITQGYTGLKEGLGF